MKFIIHISSKIRNGQAVRHPDFIYSEAHGLYIYQGRELSSNEFNEAADRVFSERYMSKGMSFAPKVVKAVIPVSKPFSTITPEVVVENIPEVATTPESVIAEIPKAPSQDAPRVPTRRPRKSDGIVTL